jgi:D-glycero-D-manno-heptose 1,7-bisphosphate phosphatase
MERAVFLDRDGVINKAIVKNGKPFPPASISQLELIPGVTDALQSMKQLGFKLIVITNQPDVARGTMKKSAVNEINDYLLSSLPILEINTCFHDSEENCDCRKPKPGAIVAAAKRYSIDLTSSYMIGDRWRDIEAGQRAGCRTIFIDYGYDEKQPDSADYSVTSLMGATKIIIRENCESDK